MNFIICNGEQIPSITVDSVSNNSIPLLLTFPHSGDYYPDDFCPNPALSFEVIDFQNDKFVDELYQASKPMGLTSIKANFARVYIDVNRHQHDIDSKMMVTDEPWYGRLHPTVSGLETGTSLFWSKSKLGIYDVYDRKLSQKEMKRRLATCYIPFHQAVTSVLEDIRQQHHFVYVLDCHSYTKFDSKLRGGGQRPQVDIGNRKGQSCSQEYTQCVADTFTDCGYDVTINGRFIGGEMQLRYGWPEINQHILQVEIRRDMYMNEETREKTERFAQMQMDCYKVLKAVKAYVDQQGKTKEDYSQ